MQLQNKQIILNNLKNEIDENNLVLFTFRDLPNKILKQHFRDLKLKGVTCKHVKTSMLRLLKLDLQFANYALIFPNSAIQEVLNTLNGITIYKYYDIHEIATADYIIPTGPTTYRPSTSFKLLEKMTKVSIKKGFVNFDEEYKIVTKGQKINKNQSLVLHDFGFKLKRVTPLIQKIIITNKDYTETVNELTRIEIETSLTNLKLQSEKLLFMNPIFIENNILKLYIGKTK